MERRKFAAEFKREAVRLANQAGVSKANVATASGFCPFSDAISAAATSHRNPPPMKLRCCNDATIRR